MQNVWDTLGGKLHWGKFMEERSLIKSIDVKFFSPCENEKRVGHPVTLNGKLGFGSGGGNYTTPTHINFYHFHFLTLTF